MKMKFLCLKHSLLTACWGQWSRQFMPLHQEAEGLYLFSEISADQQDDSVNKGDCQLSPMAWVRSLEPGRNGERTNCVKLSSLLHMHPHTSCVHTNKKITSQKCMNSEGLKFSPYHSFSGSFLRTQSKSIPWRSWSQYRSLKCCGNLAATGHVCGVRQDSERP